MIEQLINKLYSVSQRYNWYWFEPLVNNTLDNEVVLEWWKGEKKLTIYISNTSTDYIKVWGADMDNEMEDGLINSDKDIVDIWKWFSN